MDKYLQKVNAITNRLKLIRLRQEYQLGRVKAVIVKPYCKSFPYYGLGYYIK